MRIDPLYDRIIVRVIRDTKTKSGLYVPEVAFNNSPMMRGEVLHVGPGAFLPDGTRRPMSVGQGSIVWFHRRLAEPIPYDGYKAGDVMIMPEEAIIAVLSELPEVSSLVDSAGGTMLVEPKTGIEVVS